jgi:hypothetical protein
MLFFIQIWKNIRTFLPGKHVQKQDQTSLSMKYVLVFLCAMLAACNEEPIKIPDILFNENDRKVLMEQKPGDIALDVDLYTLNISSLEGFWNSSELKDSKTDDSSVITVNWFPTAGDSIKVRILNINQSFIPCGYRSEITVFVNKNDDILFEGEYIGLSDLQAAIENEIDIINSEEGRGKRDYIMPIVAFRWDAEVKRENFNKIMFCIIRAYLCKAEELETPYSLMFNFRRAEIHRLYGVYG